MIRQQSAVCCGKDASLSSLVQAMHGQGPNPILMASSLAYLIPMIAALQSNAFYAAVVSANLMVTSVLYHWSKDPHYFWVDQVAVYLYLVAAVYESFFKGKTSHQILVAVMGVYATCVYHFGKAHECYVWDTDCSVATQHHAAMHMVSAVAGSTLFLT
jgi:hypothetical protein